MELPHNRNKRIKKEAQCGKGGNQESGAGDKQKKKLTEEDKSGAKKARTINQKVRGQRLERCYAAQTSESQGHPRISENPNRLTMDTLNSNKTSTHKGRAKRMREATETFNRPGGGVCEGKRKKKSKDAQTQYKACQRINTFVGKI